MLKEIKIVNKKSVGIVPVYDVCVPGPHHYLLGDGTVSHNSGFVYASSIIVAMQKLKLKEDEDGNKVSEVRGIRSSCKVIKTRYSKPFESIKINIPWEHGMDPISGLFDLFESSGVLVKEGNRYRYVSKRTGEIMKYFRKEWNDFDKLKVIMDEFTQDDLGESNSSEITSEVTETEITEEATADQVE